MRTAQSPSSTGRCPHAPGFPPAGRGDVSKGSAVTGSAGRRTKRTKAAVGAVRPPAGTGGAFTEKSFYLDEFRGHTLVFAIRGERLRRRGGVADLGAVAAELLPNDTRMLVLVDAEGRGQAAGVVRSIRRRLGGRLEGAVGTLGLAAARRCSRAGLAAALPAGGGADDMTALARIWSALRQAPIFVGVIPCRPARLANCAQELARRLHAHKLVLVEDEGGISDATGSQISFMDATMLGALLRAGQAEWTGVAHRRGTLEAVRQALHGGVAAVNLCSLDGLARELFTYEGAGTLFTLEDYCRVAPLGIDDYEEVERLIERGQREGILKIRTPREIAEIVVCGYGATIGAHHLAGVCALHADPYRAQRAGEIVALYTLTRFKGEGIGRKLLAHVDQEARARGLRYLFAVTTEVRAQALFERNGFTRVRAADVPAAKWKGYDPARRKRLAVLRRDLRA